MSDCSDCGLLFLVGARGTGKTTVARLLAGRLGWQWCDADTLFESRHGSIRGIFDTEGERAFREKESEILRDVATLSQHVVATGGGVILREENRAILRQGWVVWLTAEVDTICARLRADATTGDRRPALTATGSAVSPEEVAAILQARTPLYRACADLTVRTDGLSPEEIVEEIVIAFTKE
jgi:shikimate kinase